MSGRSLIAVLVPFIIGLLFLTGTVVTFAETASFFGGATRTEATFVGSIAKTGGNHGGTFFYPQFRFTSGNGRVITITSSLGSTGQPYEVGQKVPVLYDPRHPDQAELDSLEPWITPLFLAPFALLLTIIPAIVFISIRRRRAPAFAPCRTLS